MIISSQNQKILNNTKIHFKDASVNLSESMHLYLILDEEISSLSINLRSSEVFKLYNVHNDEVNVTEHSTLSNVHYQVINSKHVYTINIMCTSEDAGSFTDSINITVNGIQTTAELYCDVEGLDEQLTVTLQNFKKLITEEYMQAMYETHWKADSVDARIYNRKIREYLMNILSIDAMSGTYESLHTTLQLFGYGELLELREYWKSIDTTNETYKSTAITNAVRTQIEKSLSGYRKTNQMSLVYQINTPQGVDDDSLPVYVNVLSHTDEILFKLWTLERILERDFMHLNSHIIDILGEFQTVIGLEFNVILNNAHVDTVHLTEDMNHSIKVNIQSKDVFILRHDVLLENEFVFTAGDPELERIPTATAGTQSDTFFDIKRILKSSETSSEDYDMLTKYYSGDFGLIQFDIELDSSRYQTFKWILLNDEGQEVFESQLKTIDNLGTHVICGTKITGDFKLLLYVFDWYGGASVLSISDVIKVRTRDVDFYPAAYGSSGSITHDIKMWTTFRDTKNIVRNPVVDNISETLDINTWDSATNTPHMQISRWYNSDFDQLSTWTNLNQLNSIKLSSLRGLPLNIHGYTYSVFVADIMGSGQAGPRVLNIKLFEDKPYTTFEMFYDGVESELSFLQKVASSLNVFSNEFGNFTYDIHLYSNNPEASISDARPMLRGKSKLNSFKNSHYTLYIDNYEAHTDFPEIYFKNDARLFSQQDAILQFSFIEQATSNLLFELGNKQFILVGLELSNIQEVYDQLVSLIQDNNLQNVITTLHNDIIYVSSANDITLHHKSIGAVTDIVRGDDDIYKIQRISVGSDIRLGEPVFAFIDSDRRHDLSNITWILQNAYTNEIISVQNSYAFRWVMSKIGSYSLTLKTSDIDGDRISIKRGIYIVRDFYDELYTGSILSDDELYSVKEYVDEGYW